MAVSQSISVNNVKPRIDTDGNIVDAHDGRLIQFNDTFYWYGTSYGNTNGFVTENHYVCYISKDLKVWKKEGRLLPNQPEGVYYRPHVVYNKKTKRYVLWYNWYPKLWNGQFGVATSKNPEGPFKIVNSNVKMFRSDVGLGDFGLFVDDDQTCYLSYNTIQNHQVSVEKLDKKYTASTMENGGIIAEHMEAGTQFKKDGKYYLMTDYTCCFCNYGSGARVYISDNPLNGYQLTGNINRYPGKASLVINDGVTRGTLHETIEKTDSIFNAVEVQFSGKKIVDNITISLFTGNRPENCGDVSNPRVHPEIETPKFKLFSWNFNTWEAINPEDITVIKSALQEQVSIDFNDINSDRIKIVPVAENYPFDKLYINEVALSSEEKIVSKEASFYITAKTIPQRPIIPAQQSYVTKLQTAEGEKYFWVGDLWGSASDNVKGHDYQYWSKPLEFNDDGTIIPMTWEDTWKL
ncbi:family 43 glycosylhydrolase [Algibacter sp. 2305UL17-15]|uniref:family 43 glycosylhydrolase n=1 Tax=Algibacter sp. 2305UL17-15 TaxID=3231268 RepID=UPI0034597AC4